MKIDITEKHKVIIMEALDLYVRAGIGQLESVVNNRFTESKLSQKDIEEAMSVRREIESYVARMKRVVYNQPLNGSIGLYHPDVPKDAQIAREIMHAIEGTTRLTNHEAIVKIEE